MKSTILAAVSILALSCGAALAQGPGGPGGGLVAADANKDGVITKAEFDTQRTARFAELDTNKDGFLSDAERAAGRAGGPPPGAQAGGPPPGGGGGGNMDANGDGKISKAEFLANNGMFARVDTNKDGKIDAAERAAMPARGGGRGPGG
jgi:hypothetical protein